MGQPIGLGTGAILLGRSGLAVPTVVFVVEDYDDDDDAASRRTGRRKRQGPTPAGQFPIDVAIPVPRRLPEIDR